MDIEITASLTKWAIMGSNSPVGKSVWGIIEGDTKGRFVGGHSITTGTVQAIQEVDTRLIIHTKRSSYELKNWKLDESGNYMCTTLEEVQLS